MQTTDEIIIPQIDPELLAGSQALNFLPGSPGEGDIKEEDDDQAADYISFTMQSSFYKLCTDLILYFVLLLVVC